MLKSPKVPRQSCYVINPMGETGQGHDHKKHVDLQFSQMLVLLLSQDGWGRSRWCCRYLWCAGPLPRSASASICSSRVSRMTSDSSSSLALQPSSVVRLSSPRFVSRQSLLAQESTHMGIFRDVHPPLSQWYCILSPLFPQNFSYVCKT